MSHFTKIERANIVSVDAFAGACAELGCHGILRNTTIKDYFGKTTQVAVAVKVGKFHIGLKKNARGTYDMISDWWGIRTSGNLLPEKLRKVLGHGFSDVDIQDAFLRYTTKRTIVERYRRQGYRVNVKENLDQGFTVNMTKF